MEKRGTNDNDIRTRLECPNDGSGTTIRIGRDRLETPRCEWSLVFQVRKALAVCSEAGDERENVVSSYRRHLRGAQPRRSLNSEPREGLTFIS